MDARYYDYLTDLPNITRFFETAAEKKDALIKSNTPPALLFLNIDGMKAYNQTHGFPAGNELLHTFAGVLSDAFTREQCCRLGGVYFAVLTEDKNLEFTLRQFFDNCEKLSAGDGFSVHVGIYPFKTEDVNIHLACDRAKLACNALKNDRLFDFGYYDAELRQEEENKRYIIENIDRAIAERWITVYYQPIVRAVNNRVCDEECLARWIDPIKGFLSPADFIPILEEASLIYKLDLYVVERALEKIKFLESKGIYPVTQSINLSRSDFETCDIVSEVCSRVDAAGVSHSKLNIEITESVMGSNFDALFKQILRFKARGFSIWMDDFGSGYSSLTVLKQIPFDLIKFDMGFMRQFDKKDNGKTILTGLMKMAFALGVDTVCEGVETEEQLQFLREIGCSKIQGFYYGKPLPLEQVMAQIEGGMTHGYENPEESQYYETVGRVNLHDIAILAQESGLNTLFNVLPMAIVEFDQTSVHFIRSNQSYRDFIARSFYLNMAPSDIDASILPQISCTPFLPVIQRLINDSTERTFFDATLPDNSTAHYFIRKLSENPVTKKHAFAVAVLSVMDAKEVSAQRKQKAQLEKARQEQVLYSRLMALSGDYIAIYVVDPRTETYTEYNASIDYEKLGIAKQGTDFFAESRKNAKTRIAAADQDAFTSFTKEHVLAEIAKKGVFTMHYHLLIDGKETPVNLRIAMVKESDAEKLIVGVRI